MNQLTHVAQRLVAGAVVALAMTVGLTSLTVAGSSAAETSARGVVGKSDLGKITSTVVGKTSAGDKVGGSFTPINVIERDGVHLVVDPMSFQYLAGAEVDYQEGLEGSRFVIKNPNAATTCGCGQSFSI